MKITIERQCQHWAQKIQDEDKHSRDNVNIGHTRYRMKINNRSCILCTQCWQRPSIVCLHPVSCVPNVDSVSRLFIFILYLVCPMLTLSLECLSSSCILCAQCWHCLSSVYLHPVSCVPNVDSVSRLCQHWVHKIQDEDKQSRDNVNIGYTRYRMKTNNRETLSTLGTQDTGWRQTLERHCQHWDTRYRMKINTRETLWTLGTQDTGWR